MGVLIPTYVETCRIPNLDIPWAHAAGWGSADQSTKDNSLARFCGGAKILYLICRIQNPDIPQARQGTAGHGGEAGRGGAERDGSGAKRCA